MKLFRKAKYAIATLLGKETSSYPVEASDQDIECLKFCTPFTMTSVARLYSTLSSIKYVINNNIDGDIVECGVWRGGNSMIIAKTMADLRELNRDIYLFDTFEGMTPPTDMDLDTSGRSAQSQLNLSLKRGDSSIWCIASIDDVASNLSSTGFPSRKIHLVKGDVAKTLEEESNLPKHISLLRLDTDWYESTKKELQILFPRLVKGGVCLIDDYGHWQGARKAVDEYFAEHSLHPLVHITDYTGRAFIKN